MMGYIDEFINNKICVCCRSEYESINFVDWCHKHNITWDESRYRSWWNDIHWNDETGCICCFCDMSKLDCTQTERGVEVNRVRYYGRKVVMFKQFMEEVKNMEFTKEDLKTGMLIKTREGKLYKVYLGTEDEEAFCTEEGFWIGLASYKDDMTHKKHPEFDVIKVYNYSCKAHLYSSYKATEINLIWEREDIQELTMTELNELLVKLGYNKKVKIVE